MVLLGFPEGLRVHHDLVRFIHHVLTWVILIFVPIHVYLALRADFTERGGSISSIVSGGRWVRDDIDYEDA